MNDVPREDLIRMIPFERNPQWPHEMVLRMAEDGNTLVGYAAVFNRDTEINSWEGRFVERISPGAFRKTLVERGDQVKVLFNHGMDPQIGDKPLGKPSVMKEDKRGLYVEVPLDDTSYNRDLKASLKSGALDGMSFRMTVTRDDWDDLDSDLPSRTIREIKLFEFGPVTFPAYEATEAGVRAHAPRAYKAWQEARGEPVVPTPPADVEPPEGGSPSSEAPPEGHPDEERQDAPPEGDASAEESTDAPPDAGHPSQPHRRQPPERLAAKFASVEALAAISDERFAHHEPSVRRHMAAKEEAS